MTPNELKQQFIDGFNARKFTAGLLVSFIDLLVDLDVPNQSIGSFDDLTDKFPRQLVTARGGRANTLILRKPDGKNVSLRPFYNSVETYYRAEMKRYDYPSCAPHATQAWIDYKEWLDALVTYDLRTLNKLRSDVNAFVLETLTDQTFDPTSVNVEPPLFRLLLEGFDMTARKGEPTGASYQGLVFGFLRADNPHLQIEIDKVRVGSKRLQRVGDIDCWEGDRLAISAEVKQLELKPTDVSDLEGFGNETGRRGTLGLLVALAFQGTSKTQIEDIGLRPLDLNDLIRIVDLWDPLKQRTAVASFVYYAKHVEKNSSLSSRIDEFLKAANHAD